MVNVVGWEESAYWCWNWSTSELNVISYCHLGEVMEIHDSLKSTESLREVSQGLAWGFSSILVHQMLNFVISPLHL